MFFYDIQWWNNIGISCNLLPDINMSHSHLPLVLLDSNIKWRTLQAESEQSRHLLLLTAGKRERAHKQSAAAKPDLSWKAFYSHCWKMSNSGILSRILTATEQHQETCQNSWLKQFLQNNSPLSTGPCTGSNCKEVFTFLTTKVATK